MIRQKIVTQCSLIRLPGFPDNTVINYVFCPHVLSQNSDFFFLFRDYISCLSSEKLSLISCYCNPGLIKSSDSTEVFGVEAVSCYQPISPHSCSLLLFLALSPPANMPINCPDCSPFWGFTAKFMTETMIFFFFSQHLFMGSKRVVCAILLLFSSSSCCL